MTLGIHLPVHLPLKSPVVIPTLNPHFSQLPCLDLIDKMFTPPLPNKNHNIFKVGINNSSTHSKPVTKTPPDTTSTLNSLYPPSFLMAPLPHPNQT